MQIECRWRKHGENQAQNPAVLWELAAFKERNVSRRAGISRRSFLGSNFDDIRDLFNLSSNLISSAFVSFSFSCHSTNSRSFFVASLLNSKITCNDLNKITPSQRNYAAVLVFCPRYLKTERPTSVEFYKS